MEIAVVNTHGVPEEEHEESSPRKDGSMDDIRHG
jgi:hypothetical protein